MDCYDILNTMLSNADLVTNNVQYQYMKILH
jgi:hypothetical protein